MNQQDLINKLQELENLTPDERAYLLDLVNTKKKYGLVWEEKPEDAEEQLRESLPVLTEVKEKAIVNGEKHPNHILIEGDNLPALTTLTFTHEGKIDVIYIDPPYNTGNKDFKYNDSFVDKEDSFRHSKWISFMHKRLNIAKRLLSDTGVIFISIDDNEQAQLKMLCDEVFGENNFIGAPVRRRRGSQANLSKNIAIIHEYVFIYRKSAQAELNNIKPKINTASYKNPDNDPRGPYVTMPCTNQGGAKYAVQTPTGKLITDEWRFKEETYYKLLNNNKLVFPKNGAGKPRYKLFLSEKEENGVIDNSWWESIATNQEATIELKEVFSGQANFNNPKPIGLINHILNLSTSNKRNYYILDFFAGSGTTLHATMQLNAEDGGNRQCILVTNNENNICEEVTYERNKRVIKGYSNAKGQQVQGLINNNLRYYQCAYAPRETSLKNKRVLTRMATELLCIKEDCYTDCTNAIMGATQNWLSLFTNGKEQYFCTIYDDSYIEEGVTVLQQLILTKKSKKPVKVYVFSNGQYPYTEEFEEVLEQIILCALPDAIYKAYQNVLPARQQKGAPIITEGTVAEVELSINNRLQATAL